MSKINRMRAGAANPNTARELVAIHPRKSHEALLSVPGEKKAARDSSCDVPSTDELSRLSADWELSGILNKDVDLKSLAYVLREHAYRNNFDVISFEKVLDFALRLGMKKKAVVRAVEILRDAGYVGTCGINDTFNSVCVNPKLLGTPVPCRCLSDQHRKV
ncbi:hypothetical protein [Burkholderia vietnamiensis]|uniref:hypothetical protein n=1 Tax=Burkholderia vietnamiensis TaxID=60552 RepID=UPI000A867515|nr:hypothetical protein [Burkholderia vietnamiensis]MCA7986621.1 hypothetical protein [Burkholderia vietnamiensis]HDR8931505.1 hypothetical protein [Burkholderia vietnamiensis]